MKLLKIISQPAIVLIAILMFSACSGSKDSESNSSPQSNGFDLPASRSFYMGFTPFPYDYLPEALNYTYDMLNLHADLYAHHLDAGVPWGEALLNQPFSATIETRLNDRVSRTPAVKTIYLAITPLGPKREGIALYWGDEEETFWANKPLDDPDVIEAYTNYCRYMINKFNPDYMAYGIEVNMLDAQSPDQFDNFLILIQQVYTTIKGEFPNLPLFLTLQIDIFYQFNQTAVINQILPYTDYIAVSTYPFIDPTAAMENPADIPANWFSAIAALAPGKPFAVAETTFTAEDLLINTLGIDNQGSAQWQKDYVDFLFNSANDLNAEFIVWFFIRDYDDFWPYMEQLGAEEFLKAWKDSGLIDGSGNARISLGLWDAWLDLPQ